ncbi:MAG: hypothetical protein M3436_14665 [Pseudomonadota bacterium]|nr:hypothetical protein [Pseudomonadota bacterium]
MRTAVVHPVHALVLRWAKEAADAGLYRAGVVGPKAKIDASAEAEGLDLGAYDCVYTQHSHEAAARAVSLARKGEVDALMMGSLYTDELMEAVVVHNGVLRSS